MTPDQLSAAAGITLSLALAYVPGLREVWEPLDGTRKRAVLGLMLIAVAAGSVGASCAGWIDTAACDRTGVMAAGSALISALIGSQAAYVVAAQSRQERTAERRLGAWHLIGR
jgi:uncharacterized membrane protein YeaQ/YmgE (transglycosylase-associated protein family)